MNKETPEYRAIEEAANWQAFFNLGSPFNETGEGKKTIQDYIAGALSPEAKAFHLRPTPVTESLPEPGERVLVYSKTLGWQTGWRDIHGNWYCPSYGIGFPNYNVTHWQELPPAP